MTDEADFLATWREELAPYGGSDFKAALEQMRLTYVDFPPTLFQFSNLCRDAARKRTDATPRLNAPAAEPTDPVMIDRAKAVGCAPSKPDRRWAHKILNRAETEPAGLRPPRIAIEMAKEALGL